MQEDRAGGLAKSWRSVTVLLDDFRKAKLTDDERRDITWELAAVGVTVLPPLESCDRQSKVRLLLPGESADAPQDLVAEGLVSASCWSPRRGPVPVRLDEHEANPTDVLWVDVLPGAEVRPTLELLRPLLPGLTEDAVSDLLQVDDLPGCASYGVVHKVSTVGVYAVEEEGTPVKDSLSKAGQLVFQVVEVLVGPGWIATCWHEPRGTRTKTPPDGLDDPGTQPVRGVVSCWLQQETATAGTLGLLLVRELARSYLDARRTLHSWLEQWELDFHRSAAATEQDTLRELGVLVGEFQRRLTALDETRHLVHGGGWLPGAGAVEVDRQLGALLHRSREDLQALSGSLRASVELMSTAGIREHLRLAEVAGRKADTLQDQFGLVASVLLVPTLIAGLFGANTQIPGQGHWSGFIGMLLLMALGAVVTFAFLQHVKTRVHADDVQDADG